MDKILLIGAGGHARSCIDVLEEENQFEIAGLVEKGESISNESLGYPVIGTDDDLKVLRQQYKNALITVGQIKSPKIRIKIYQLLKETFTAVYKLEKEYIKTWKSKRTLNEQWWTDC